MDVGTRCNEKSWAAKRCLLFLAVMTFALAPQDDVFASDPAPYATITGVNGSLSSPVISADGAWRAVVERNSAAQIVAVWRSADGVNWSRIPVPSAATSGSVGLLTGGDIVLARRNGTTAQIYRFGVTWSAATNIGGLTTGEIASVLVAAGTTPTIVAVSTAGTVFSSISGGTWASSNLAGVGTVSSASLIGGTYVHVVGSGGYLRWSTATRAAVGTVNSSINAGRVMSAPGSTSTVYAAFVASEALFVRVSTNSGATWAWSAPAIPLPYRSGLVLANPTITADGSVVVTASRGEAGATAVYSASWSPVTGQWSTVRRAAFAAASATLIVWPGQQVSGAQPAEVERWLTVVDGATGLRSAWALPGVGDLSPWPTTTQIGTPSAPLSGLTGTMGSPLRSPAGGWQLLVESNASAQAVALWRSSSSTTWERIATPIAALPYARATITDTGKITLVGFTGAVMSWQFDGGDWFGSRTVASSGFGTPTSLSSNGTNYVLTTSTGYVIGSANPSDVWASPVSSGLSSSISIQVVGGYAHLTSPYGYRRWSLGSNAFAGSVISSVTSASVYSSPGSTSVLWAWNGSSLWSSSNAGGTWALTSTLSTPLRSGVTWGNSVMLADGKIHMFGSKIESAQVVLYEAAFDPATRVWSTVQRAPSGQPGGTLWIWPTQKADGSYAALVRWLISPSAPFTGFDVSGGNSPSPWQTTTQSLVAPAEFSGSSKILRPAEISSDGTWKLLVASDAQYNYIDTLWRTDGSGAWEAIPAPTNTSYIWQASILNDGTIVMLSIKNAGWCCTRGTLDLMEFRNGEWMSPRSVVSNIVWGGVTTKIVVAEPWIVVIAEPENGPYVTTGQMFVSSNLGQSWSSPANVPTWWDYDNGGSALIVDGVLHVAGNSLYQRWNLAAGGFLPVDQSGATAMAIPKGARVMTNPANHSEMWLTYGGPSLVMFHSSDGGANWDSSPSVAEYLPRGTSSNAYEISADGKIRFYAVAACPEVSLVYSVSRDSAASGSWDEVTPLYLDETKSAVILQPSRTNVLSPASANDAWFTTGAFPSFDVNRVTAALAAPESVFGFDGYGITVGGVNSAIGSYTDSWTDLSIAGVGPQLELTRTYNSADQRIGIFGRGWTSTYETRAFENCVTKDVTILFGDGRRETHYSNGAGGYITPPGYTNHLVKNGTSGWTLTSNEGVVRTFRADGRMTSIADADGQSLTLTWNGSKQLTLVTDTISGRSLSFTYSGGLVSSVATNPVTSGGTTAPIVWNYAYSGSNLAKACEPRNNDPLTGWCTLYLVSGGRITMVTDPNGHIDAKVGYSNGKVAWRENGAGERTTYTYLGTSKTIVTDPLGHTTTSEFDGYLRVTKVTDATGGITTYHYNALGFRDQVIDQLGHTETYTFDSNGNTLSVTNAMGQTTWYTYDAFGNQTSVRDARSAGSTDTTYVVTTVWDGVHHNKVSVTTPATAQQPTGTTQSWSYTNGTEPAIGGGLTPVRLLKSEVDANGGVTTYRYDVQGNLREVTDPSGLLTTHTWDQLGRKVSTTAYPTGFSAGVTTSLTLDELGQVLVQDEPAVVNPITGYVHRRRVSNVYDAARNLVSVTESDIGLSPLPDAPRVTTYTYDNADRRLSTTDPAGGVASTTYDAAGNVVQVVDARGQSVVFTYDARNLALTQTAVAAAMAEGPVAPHDVLLSTTTYDAVGRVATTTDANGMVTSYQYDLAGRQTSKTLLAFHERSGSTRDVVLEAVSYDAAGYPVTIVSGGGLITEQRVYDESGRLVQSTLDPAGVARVKAFFYDKGGNLVRETTSDAARTEEVRYSYDAGNRVISTTVENGAVDLTTTSSYDNRGAMLTRVEPNGMVPGASASDFSTTYAVDALGRTILVQSPAVTVTAGGTTTPGIRPSIASGFDTFGQATHSLDERGSLTIQSFDVLGRLVQVTYPSSTDSTGQVLQPVETFAYDAVGNQTTHTDRRGNTTTFQFDGLNRVVRQTDPSVNGNPGGVTMVWYDDASNVVAQIDQTGARVEMTYDDRGRLRTSTAVVRNGTAVADRYTTTSDYDDAGNQGYLRTPAGDVWTATFNGAAEQTSAVDPLGAAVTYTYDLMGRPSVTTDPLGRQTVQHYDLAGRLTSVERLDSSGLVLTTSTSSYDANSNVLSSTTPRAFAAGANPADYTTSFGYDSINRLISVSQPYSAVDSIDTQYGYDAAGNLTQQVDGRGNATQYEYNEWGLATKLIEPATTAYPSLSDRTWVTDYDAGGLPIRSIQPGDVTVSSTYDSLGRLVEEAGSGAGALPASRQFGYDAAGRTIELSTPAGLLALEWDDSGLLLSTSGPSQYQATFTYDDNGRVTSRSDAAGLTSYTWNARDELSTITDGLTGGTRSQTFDVAGQLIGVDYGNSSRTLEYDDLGRLTSDALHNSLGAVTAAYSYGYDLDGHVTEQDVVLPGNPSAGNNTYGYDPAGRLVSWTQPNAAVSTYVWDKSGNLISNGGVAATFDERNQLLSSGSTTNTWTPRGTMATTTTGATTTALSFDALGRLVSNGTDTYTYDSLDRIATTTLGAVSYAGTEIDPVAIDGVLIARSPGGAPVSTKAGAAPGVFVGRNQHGDIGLQHDASGAVTSTRTYDPLGATLSTTGGVLPLGYQGDYVDTTNGNTWMGARWYQPGTGSFASRDTVHGSLSTPVSLNRYTYAWNDPVSMWDPDGRWPDFGNLVDGFLEWGDETVDTVSEAVDEVKDNFEWGVESPEAVVDSVIDRSREWYDDEIGTYFESIKSFLQTDLSEDEWLDQHVVDGDELIDDLDGTIDEYLAYTDHLAPLKALADVRLPTIEWAIGVSVHVCAYVCFGAGIYVGSEGINPWYGTEGIGGVSAGVTIDVLPAAGACSQQGSGLALSGSKGRYVAGVSASTPGGPGSDPDLSTVGVHLGLSAELFPSPFNPFSGGQTDTVMAGC